VDLQRCRPGDHANDLDVDEADQSTTHQRRLDEHRDPQGGWRQTPPLSRGPCALPSILSASSTTAAPPQLPKRRQFTAAGQALAVDAY
jgi:hypothetical protein